jgi:hypothetical protein
MATAIAAALAPAASASRTQEAIIQDDPILLNARTQDEVDHIFRTFGAIGVDRVRVSLFWDHVAPARLSRSKPAFADPGPSWPGSYPRGGWDRFDRIALAAQKTGVGLLFTLTGPGPQWAAPGRGTSTGVRKPSPSEFRAFVRAAGIRYSGAYPIGHDPPPPSDGEEVTIGGTTIGRGEPPPPPSPDNLPRVDHWSIWNEPNYPTWLNPIWRNNRPKRASQMVAFAPHHYRRLVDAAWSALGETGHGRDRILIGETAPRGGKKPSQLGNAMAPAEFARELYCLKRNFRPYRGKAARVRRCPRTAAARRRFRRSHPGLFAAGGYALHPYSLDRKRWRRPTWRHPRRDNVPIANLRYMTRTLDRAAFFWGSTRRPLPIWITEYGYQTKPADPFTGVAPSRQGPLSAWGEYMAYRNPRVASVAQFLLVDDKPLPTFPINSRKSWISWQSGLYTQDFQPKPFLADYQVPIHVRRGRRSVRVFGAYRPGPNGARIAAQVQFAPRGGAFAPVKNHLVTNRRAYLNTRVRRRGRGHIRIVWTDPVTGALVASRALPV